MKTINKYIYDALFRGFDEKWTMWNPDLGKKRRFCTSLYIMGIWGNVSGFIYEWKIEGGCNLMYNLKNNFIFNQFSVRLDLLQENWRFLENHPKCIIYVLISRYDLARPMKLYNDLTFQVPDRWNSIDLADFSSTRLIGILSIWSLKVQNAMSPLFFECELGWTEFLSSGTPQHWISKGKPEKMTFKKLFFTTWKLTLFEESSTRMCGRVRQYSRSTLRKKNSIKKYKFSPE